MYRDGYVETLQFGLQIKCVKHYISMVWASVPTFNFNLTPPTHSFLLLLFFLPLVLKQTNQKKTNTLKLLKHIFKCHVSVFQMPVCVSGDHVRLSYICSGAGVTGSFELVDVGHGK